MKKFIIKSIIFTTIFILVLVAVLNPIFKDLDRSKFDKTYLDFTKAPKDSIDIMIFGSSHAMNSYNPEVIDSLLGTYSINFGLASQKLKTTNFLINEVTTNHKPKIVVIDLFKFALDEVTTVNAKNYQLKVLNTLPNSIEKFEYLWKNYSLNDMLSVTIPTYRNHNLWYDIKFNDILKPYDPNEFNFTKRGFFYLEGDLKYKDRKKFQKIDLNNYQLYPVKSSLDYLTEKRRDLIVNTIIDLKAKDIEVVLVTAPFLYYHLKKIHPKFNSSVKFIADSLEVPYIDFNSKFESLNLTVKNYKDRGHLNSSGADIVSRDLAKIIASNTSFSLDKNVDRENNKEVENRIDNIILEGNKTLINHTFLSNINGIELFTYNTNNENYIAIKLSQSIDSEFFEDKAFAIHTTLFDKDLYKVKGNKKNRIMSKSFVGLEVFNGNQYLILNYSSKTELKSFKSLKLFLMDKEKFNGVIGETLIVNNVHF